MKQKKGLSVQIKNINIPSAISEFSNLASALFSGKKKKKKTLLQQSNSLSFMCCLWLLLHYNNGVNKLQ